MTICPLEIKYLLLAAVLASLKPGCPAAEGCGNYKDTLKNIAVYKGSPASFTRLNNGVDAQWEFAPSSSSKHHSITDEDGVVNPKFVDTHAVNKTNLIISNSTVAPQGSINYSTAGKYKLEYKGANCYQKDANLVVIGSGPDVTCNACDPTNVKLSCSVVYARHVSQQIDPIMTWTNYSGATIKVDLPSPTNIDKNNKGLLLSVSVISIASNDTNTYECQLTFSPPENPSNVADNAPVFVASSSITNCSLATTTVPCTTANPTTTTLQQTMTTQVSVDSVPSTMAQVSTVPIETTTAVALNCSGQSLSHIVVYQDNPAQFRRLNNGQSVQWQVAPSSVVPDKLITITHYDGRLTDNFVSTYAVNQSQLTIFKSTVAPQGSMLYSTAGLYILNYLDPNCTTAANLIVIETGPECKCDESNPTDVRLSCSLVFAESVIQPCKAIFKWKNDNGLIVKEEEVCASQIDAYVKRSQSQLSIAKNDTTSYKCHVSFGAPDQAPLDYVTSKAPDFTASCSASCA